MWWIRDWTLVLPTTEDADRCIAVDHKGNIIDGDKIMYVCGKYLKEQGRLNGNTVVTTVMSNLGLYKALEREDIQYEQTAVGDKYVAENMMENNYSIGGEQSGHIIFSRYAATGDGILTSLMVMEACVEKKATLCDLAKEMKVYPQILRNVRVADKKSARENPKVQEAVEAAARALGTDGRILVRVERNGTSHQGDGGSRHGRNLRGACGECGKSNGSRRADRGIKDTHEKKKNGMDACGLYGSSPDKRLRR